jgi:hypothetical protein
MSAKSVNYLLKSRKKQFLGSSIMRYCKYYCTLIQAYSFVFFNERKEATKTIIIPNIGSSQIVNKAIILSKKFVYFFKI